MSQTMGTNGWDYQDDVAQTRPPYLIYALAAILIAALLYFLTTPTDPFADDDSVTGHTEPPTPAKAIPDEDRMHVQATPRKMAHLLGGTASEDVEATEAYTALTQAIGSFEDKGYTVSFVVYDLNTGRELSYDSAQERYPASSIKAPYTTSVYEELVEKGSAKLEDVEPVAKITIIESSDEGYGTLHQMFHEQAYIEWLKSAFVGSGSYDGYERMTEWYYPHISANQLALMWRHIYPYLLRDTEPAKQLAGFLEQRGTSALREALGNGVRIFSKMGWFESFSGYGSEPSTVEAGVVLATEGPYVTAVMTNAPALIEELVPIHKALDAAHKAIVSQDKPQDTHNLVA